MTAVSFSINRGSASGTGKVSDITVGALAPNANDIELRWNQTDASGKNVTRKDLKLALERFIHAIKQGGATVNYTTGVIGPP
jgi:hypothetical protein